MIARLKGQLIEKTPSYLIIDCNGVGYQVNVSLNTFEKIGMDESITLHTHFIVREDAQILYGFLERKEKEMFIKLISVNGVGPASAITMLSTLNVKEISDAIILQDHALLTQVKGIGAKTAQRITIDLKDKVDQLDEAQIKSVSSKNKTKIETLSALEVLGIGGKAIEKKMDHLLQQNPDLSTELLVKEILKSK